MVCFAARIVQHGGSVREMNQLYSLLFSEASPSLREKEKHFFRETAFGFTPYALVRATLWKQVQLFDEAIASSLMPPPAPPAPPASPPPTNTGSSSTLDLVGLNERVTTGKKEAKRKNEEFIQKVTDGWHMDDKVDARIELDADMVLAVLPQAIDSTSGRLPAAGLADLSKAVSTDASYIDAWKKSKEEKTEFMVKGLPVEPKHFAKDLQVLLKPTGKYQQCRRVEGNFYVPRRIVHNLLLEALANANDDFIEFKETFPDFVVEHEDVLFYRKVFVLPTLSEVDEEHEAASALKMLHSTVRWAKKMLTIENKLDKAMLQTLGSISGIGEEIEEVFKEQPVQGVFPERQSAAMDVELKKSIEKKVGEKRKKKEKSGHFSHGSTPNYRGRGRGGGAQYGYQRRGRGRGRGRGYRGRGRGRGQRGRGLHSGSPRLGDHPQKWQKGNSFQ